MLPGEKKKSFTRCKHVVHSKAGKKMRGKEGKKIQGKERKRSVIINLLHRNDSELVEFGVCQSRVAREREMKAPKEIENK